MSTPTTKPFKYQAYDRSGNLIKGVEQAENESEAQYRLKKQGLVVLNVSELKVKSSGRKINQTQIEEITSQLALLLRSGLKIDRAIEVLANNTANTQLRTLLQHLLNTVSHGGQLSSALEEHKNIFSTLYCEMVKIGESSGRLPEVFDRLAENLMFQRELAKKITQAMVYPAFIMAVCSLALVAIFNFVVPSMSGLFESLTELPVYTEILINTSSWVQRYQFYLLMALILAIATVIHSIGKPWFNDFLTRTLELLPLTRNALYQVERIRYSGAMALMLESGVDLATSMAMAARTVKANGIKSQLIKSQQLVSQGQSLSQSLTGIPIFDSISLSLLQVGEESGQLGRVFTEVNRRSRSAFESWVLKLTTMLEPLMIVFMGLIVGSVVVIMLLSIVSVNDVSF